MPHRNAASVFPEPVGAQISVLAPEAIADYGRLAAAVELPIASDLVYNRWQVRDLLLGGGVDVLQPDVCRAGGLTESKRIAELADEIGSTHQHALFAAFIVDHLR